MQFDFLAINKKYARLSQLGDPLEKLSKVINFEIFREKLNTVLSKNKVKKKNFSNAGRKHYDSILMFKSIVLKRLYNLSDEQLEYQITDRTSFQRFLRLSKANLFMQILYSYFQEVNLK